MSTPHQATEPPTVSPSQLSEGSFRDFVEAFPQAVIVKSGTIIIYANASAAALLGVQGSKDLLRKDFSFFVHTKDRARVVGELSDATSPFEARLVRHDGKLLVGELTRSSLKIGDTNAELVVITDLTERKQIEAKLMTADRLVSVGGLAAGLAHEINNPLAIVIMNLQMLLPELQSLSGWRAQEASLQNCPVDAFTMSELLIMAKDAADGASRVKKIISDLKVFSRADDHTKRPVDVHQIIESSVNMAWNEIKHRAKLVKDFNEVPMISANETRIGQVFLNLLLNAAQAIPEGKAETNQIRISTLLLDDDRVQVDISDTGCGIPADQQRLVFRPFFTTKPVGQGTGLGLSMCESIVSSMGGEIRLESRLGEGTTVSVKLPLHPIERAPSSFPPPLQLEPTRRRVLIIDDEPMVVSTLRRALGKDHDVVTTVSAREALGLIAAGDHFDIILCDLMMPDIGGMDVYEELVRSNPQAASRIVFMTGGAFTSRAQDFLDEVPNARLDKPLDIAVVRDLVKTFRPAS